MLRDKPPLLLPRRAVKNASIGGYHIAAGSVVYANNFALAHGERWWLVATPPHLATHFPLRPLPHRRRPHPRPPHRRRLGPRWPVFLKRHKKAKGVKTYRIAMDIGRTQSATTVGGDVGEWWVEEGRLRPFTACAVDAPPPPPPDDWVWPQEGDRIEVEVRRPPP